MTPSTLTRRQIVSAFGSSLALAACGGDEADPSFTNAPSPDDPRRKVYKIGSTPPGSMRWAGFRPGAADPSYFTLDEVLDPTGQKGINALLVLHVRFGCPACEQQSRDLPALMASDWAGLGIQVMQLLRTGPESEPEDAEKARPWRDAMKASWVVCADNLVTFGEPGANVTPIQVLINPRSGELISKYSGYVRPWGEVPSLARRNIG